MQTQLGYEVDEPNNFIKRINTKGTPKPIPYTTPAAIGTNPSKKFVTGEPWK